MAGCPTSDEPPLDEGPLEWPNADSAASSDDWLVEHRDDISVMRPRVLALNFVNDRTPDEMVGQLEDFILALAESTRYHGYDDPDAPAFLRYEIVRAVDLRDDPPPPDWPWNNSSLFPREAPVEGYWGFDYERLFGEEFAALYGIENPDVPGEHLDLCEAVELGLVHEVWIYGDADLPDVSLAEVLEIKPPRDADGYRLPGPMERCAGNGCFDAEDTLPEHCTRTLRIAFFNQSRGPGCFLESLSHGFESTGAWNIDLLPGLSPHFRRFSNHGLGERYGLPVDSWYACPYGEPCLSYPTEASVDWSLAAGSGTIEDYDPVCGNVHFMPNGEQHYDLEGGEPVRTSCRSFGLGGGPDGDDATSLFDASEIEPYRDLAPDCMGAWLVWWRQNVPGAGNEALDQDGSPLGNWWPMLFW